MTEDAVCSVWQRLRTRLLRGAFGAVAILLPVAAHAKDQRHAERAVLHVTHWHHRVEHTAYLRADSHRRDVHTARVAYRSEDRRSEGRHDSLNREDSAHIVHAAYRVGHSHYGHSDYYRGERRIVPHFSYSRLQCVPYARDVSHIDLFGDAFLWWAKAAGRYERGHMPVVGSVLNFRSTGRMPLGHVAVVTAVLSSRKILVTQANWIPGTITNDVTVEDISAQNNWSDVRVEYDNTSIMGSSSYPTYGFIYNHSAVERPVYAANAAGRNQVAEAPMVRAIAAEAPNRNLR